MKTALFYIPLPHGDELDEYHTFIAAHRIVSVQKEVIRRDAAPCLVCVVDYDDRAPSPPGLPGKSAARPDYREVLSPDAFVAYCRLREWRKEMAEAEGIPVFRIFSNEHLAEIARRKDRPPEARWIDFRGVGGGKIERYAAGIAACLAEPGADEKTAAEPA
jgi:superfamily II DNA helicase RecQ